MARTLILLSALVFVVGVVILLGTGCPPANDDLQKIIVKASSSNGCRGCDEEHSLEEVAAELLAHFDEADSDNDGLLSMQETQSIVDGLTAAQFTEMDLNADGYLSQEELNPAQSEGEVEDEGEVVEGEGEGESVGEGEGEQPGEGEGEQGIRFLWPQVKTAFANEPFIYQIEVVGADGPVTFSLGMHPYNMTLDSATGLVQWTPTTADIPKSSFEIIATDSRKSIQTVIPILIAGLTNMGSSTITANGPSKEIVVENNASILDGLTVFVPSRAFSEQATITVSEVNHSECVAYSRKPVTAFAMRMDSASVLEEPISVILPVDIAAYPLESVLKVHSYDKATGAWEEIQILSRNQETGALTLIITPTRQQTEKAKQTLSDKVYVVEDGDSYVNFSQQLFKNDSGQLEAQVQILSHKSPSNPDLMLSPLDTIPVSLARIAQGALESTLITTLKGYFEAHPTSFTVQYKVELYKKKESLSIDLLANDTLLDTKYLRYTCVESKNDNYTIKVHHSIDGFNTAGPALESIEFTLDKAEKVFTGGRWLFAFGIAPEAGAQYYIKTEFVAADNSGLSMDNLLFSWGEGSLTTGASPAQSTFSSVADKDGDGLPDADDPDAVNHMPKVTITSPSNGTIFKEGDYISLQGTANDQEDGEIDPYTLEWVSSLDGGLGTGCERDVYLSPGSHVITLLAVDSQNVANSASVTVTVSPNPGYASPELTIVTPEDRQRGDITIKFNVNDPDGKKNSFKMNWSSSEFGYRPVETIKSTSAGRVEQTIWDTFILRDIPPGSHSLVWNSAVDFPDRDGYVSFIMIPLDEDDRQNNPVETGAFLVYNRECYYVNFETSSHGWISVVPEYSDDCYPPGTTLTLTPQPSDGYVFSEWGGNATGNDNPLHFLVDGIEDTITIAAYFEEETIEEEGETSPEGELPNEGELPREGEVPTETILLPGNMPLEMVWIPAGTFLMGSPTTESGRLDSETQHAVTLSRDFYLGKYEVTQAQWLAVMGSWPGGRRWDRGQGDTSPAYYVSWDDTQTFITALNTHITKTGQGAAMVRLPSEAEWEYACRAGAQTRFYFGDSLDCDNNCQDCAAGELPGNRSDYMWYCGNNSPSGAKPVGGKSPNAFGLYDMHGNVWEWCLDWVGTYPSDAVTDPTGPTSGSFRVCRGGCWENNAWYCRSAIRDKYSPGTRGNGLGFRLAAWPLVR